MFPMELSFSPHQYPSTSALALETTPHPPPPCSRPHDAERPAISHSTFLRMSPSHHGDANSQHLPCISSHRWQSGTEVDCGLLYRSSGWTHLSPVLSCSPLHVRTPRLETHRDMQPLLDHLANKNQNRKVTLFSFCPCYPLKTNKPQ